MKSIFIVTLYLSLQLLSGASLAQSLQVFVSVLPQKYFVERVGGEHVQVQAMVGAGHSPATYSPSPKQISALAKSVLYVRTGVPFEQAWMARIVATNPTMQVLDLRDGLELHTLTAHSHANEHHAGHEAHAHAHEAEVLDPHIWTDPVQVQHMAAQLRDTLSALDPDHRAAYTNNAAAFIDELKTLNAEIQQHLQTLPQRKFMVYHPAWGYFARRYDLEQIPIEKAGKEPGARSLAALFAQAEREQVKVLFVQPQFDRKLAQHVAQRIGGTVIPLDPLAEDYVNNLRHVVQQLAQALGETQ